LDLHVQGIRRRPRRARGQSRNHGSRGELRRGPDRLRLLPDLGGSLLMIELVNLHKRFDGQRVLQGVQLTIAEGELTAIIGKSGCGKTVLLKHIVRLLRPDSGRVLVDGVDIAHLRGRSLDRMRERFGVLFQGGALFDSLTIFVNVAFPLREKNRASETEIAKRVRERLADMELEDAASKYLSEISGG